MHRSLLAAVVGAGLSLVAIRAQGPSIPPQAARSPAVDWQRRHTPEVEAVRRAREAAVDIHSERTAQAQPLDDLLALAPSQNRINGMGSGIVIDPRGYIVTNYHVVEDVQYLRCHLADGTVAPARVVARDHEQDLALLKIDVARPLPVMPLGTARDLMVGEPVVAIGNAYGYAHTTSAGIVSAVGRDVTLNKEVSYKSLIQTDAAINPGNSGGPLINVLGDLVGVNVAIRAGAQNIGFAIPVDTMIRVAAQMLAGRGKGAVAQGLAVRDEVQVAGPDAPFRRDAVVDRVEPDSAAAKAGLRRGDLLLKVGDVSVSSSLDVERGLLDRPAGDRVAVVLRRGGQEQTVELTLEGPRASAASAGPPGDLAWRRLGLRLQPISPDGVTRVNSQLHGGLLVADVRPDGAAGRAGLQRGDVLVGLHQWEMLTLDNVRFVLEHPDLASFNPLRFYILRGSSVHRGWLQAE
jgi:serine protease Do